MRRPSGSPGPPSVALLLLLATSLAVAGRPRQAPATGVSLGPGTPVAAGVTLFRADASSLVEPPGPVAVQALRVDPAHVDVAVVLARDGTPARQPVADIAAQHGAIAAVNASFFEPIGRHVGLLKTAGHVVALASPPRGAVAWVRGGEHLRFLFDRVRSSLEASLGQAGGTAIPIDHLNPAASSPGVTLYTGAFRLPIRGRVPPAGSAPGARGSGEFGADAPSGGTPGTDTAQSPPASPPVHVWRWRLGGTPLRVQQVSRDGTQPWFAGNGAVLVYRSRGAALPARLRPLVRGAIVELVEKYDPALGSSAEQWREASHAVSGAGLIVRDGQPLTDWSDEGLREGFTTERHPRTMTGTDADGRLWLITVDGRRPQYSVGMTFTELQRLASALALVNALNLDGGGSTTMVVHGEVVNRPSDLAGPRGVPDAIAVLPLGR